MMAAIVTTQHGEHASLFRPWPAFARGASFGLRLARLVPRANGLMRCNGSPLARGDDFDGRCFDFGAVGSRANACLRRRAHRIILDSDCLEALLGDAKRHGSSFSIASPGQQRAIGADLFKQPSADEPIDGLSNRFARNVCRQVNPAIIAPRSRGQNDELGIGESCHRDPPLRWCGVIAAATTTTAPPRPCSRRGRIPRARRAPGTVTLPLCLRPNASPFWIMLLLVLGKLDNGMICVWQPNTGIATHSFRKTLVLLGGKICKSAEEYKAWSQNLGHEDAGGDRPRDGEGAGGSLPFDRLIAVTSDVAASHSIGRVKLILIV